MRGRGDREGASSGELVLPVFQVKHVQISHGPKSAEVGLRHLSRTPPRKALWMRKPNSTRLWSEYNSKEWDLRVPTSGNYAVGKLPRRDSKELIKTPTNGASICVPAEKASIAPLGQKVAIAERILVNQESFVPFHAPWPNTLEE